MDADGVGLSVQGRDLRAAGDPERRSACRRSGCSGSSDYSARLAAEKGMPYVFAHHFSGSGTAEALELYRSQLPALARARRAADLPDRQRRRWRRPHEEARAAGAARSCWRWSRCAPAAPLTAAAAGRGGREGRAARRAPRPDVDAMRQRWVIGDPATARARIDELAATYGVDEVMVHPVAGAYDGHRPATAAPAARRRSGCWRRLTRRIRVSRPVPTKLACRPNVGLFRGASRLPGSPLESLHERFAGVPGTRSTERLHEVHRIRSRSGGSRATWFRTSPAQCTNGRQPNDRLWRTCRRKKA